MKGREAHLRSIQTGAEPGRVDCKEDRAPGLVGCREDHGGRRSARATDARRARTNRQGHCAGQVGQTAKGDHPQRGSQGTVGKNDTLGERHGPTVFEKLLVESDMRHAPASVARLQTTGKIECPFGEIKARRACLPTPVKLSRGGTRQNHTRRPASRPTRHCPRDLEPGLSRKAPAVVVDGIPGELYKAHRELLSGSGEGS